jgi:hypothetical protein
VPISLQDIESLLAVSCDLLGAQELDDERLKVWAAERNAIFSRLKENDSALTSADPSSMALLLRQQLDLDAKIYGRLVEDQKRIGQRISAARKIREALSQETSHKPRLLQRFA